MADTDPFDLDRFVEAQARWLDAALAELRAGRKRTHWMWFVFPQLRGLGSSEKALRYGIGSMDEARAYLAHALLGPRLKACTCLVLSQDGTTLSAIFGSPDDLKFASSMTLFEAAGGEAVFGTALDRFRGGERDRHTLALLAESRP